MAEAVGLTASVIAIVQLTGKLIALGYEYIGGVKSASKDMRDLVDELQSLGKVLAILKDHVQADQNLENTALQSLNGQNGPIQGCSLELKRLQAKLEPNTGWWKRKLSTLKWPLEEKETSRYIIRIERQKNLFNFALSTDQLTLSKEIKVYVRNTEDIARNLQTESTALSKELEAYTRSTTLAFQRIETDIQDLQVQSLAIQNWSQKEGIRSTEKERKELLSWLHPESFDKKHTEISNRRKANTGGWILKTPEFESWSKGLSDSRLILGHGIPGAGKTFISSLVIDHFRTLRAQTPNSSYGVAYIYFDYKEREQQMLPNIVARLLKQLIGQTELIPTEVRSLYHKSRKSGERPTFTDLEVALLAALPSFAQLFLIFDALDECHQANQRNEILKFLCRLGDAGANLFLTSRPHQQDIQSSLKSALKVEILAKQGDIMTYIEQKIDENQRAKSLITRGGCKERIISDLVDCAQGMFLMVHFHIEHLCQQTTVRQVLTELEMLKNFSTEERPLDPTYDRAMEKIRSQSKSCAGLALRALSWLVKAKRPLKVNELLEAVSVRPNVYKLEEWDLPEKETLLDVCASLVIIHEDIVRLAHYTVQEYLLTKIITGDVHSSLAITCITYISFDIFAGGYYDYQAILDLQEINPFLSYAATYLRSHLKEAYDETPTTEPILYLLASPGNSGLYQRLLHYGAMGTFELLPTLHLATSLGNSKVVRLLLEGANASVPDSDGWRMVCLARDKGHHAVAQMLLGNSIKISTLSPKSQKTALHIAVLGRCPLLVQLLIEKGADTSAKDSNGCTPLYDAVERGREDIIRVLLDNGVDITAVDHMGNTPLHNAVEQGKEQITRFLLDNGADISTANSKGNTPLHNAAKNGREGIIRVLVDNGADITAVDHMGNTPLHNAVEQGKEKIIRFLLYNGADISTANSKGNTPLQNAIRSSENGIIMALLGSEEDLAASKTGNTPLHYAVDRGMAMIIRMLLDNNCAGISTANLHGNTPLHNAARNGCKEEIIRLLLDNGADVFAVNRMGDTPLHNAVKMGREENIRALLDNGADLSTTNRMGNTPLHDAVYMGRGKIIRVLLDYGADVSTANLEGNTPLHNAAKNGREEIIRVLLDNGADVTAVNLTGDTLLYHAIKRRMEEIIRIALRNGADIFTALLTAIAMDDVETLELLLEKARSNSYNSKRNAYGRTALHIALLKGTEFSTLMAKLLLKNNPDVSIKDLDGMTALHLAVSRGYEEEVLLLIENGSNTSTKDSSGEPVLHMAVMVSRDKETVIRMLLENQADISAKDSLGKTALHLAVSLGYGRVTRLLLESCASISEACFVGMTALHIAASCGNSEITKLLLENGADISSRNKIGWTPFQIAAYRGHNEVAQLLLEKDTNCVAQNSPMGIIPPLPLRSQIPAKSRYLHGIEYPRAKRQKRQ